MPTLCFQVTKKMSPGEIVKKLNKNIFSPQTSVLKKDKVKTVLAGEKMKIKRQYSQQEIKIKKLPGVEMHLEIGIAHLEEKVREQRDIYLIFATEQIPQVVKIATMLLQKLPLILVEPRLDFRFGQEDGSFSPLQMPSYRTGTLEGGIWAHLTWQIYTLNGAWLKYLANPKDKVVLRQLRIKLRRLRSCLSFFRPAFQSAACTKWQKRLRGQGLELGKLRELDVMLISLVRLGEVAESQGRSSQGLQAIFGQKRDKQLAKLLKNQAISSQTQVLTEFILWLQSEPWESKCRETSFQKFIVHRFKVWSKKILNMMEGSPDFSDMKKAHKIRIEIKKFRYVLLSFKEINKGALPLLRQLKRLQDVLGFLHDDYVNSNLVKALAEKGKGVSADEAALFAGWESAKVEASIEILQNLWQNFSAELSSWRKSID